MLGQARQFVSEVANIARFAGPATAARFVWAAVEAGPAVLKARSLAPADRAMRGPEVRVRVPGAQVLSLPTAYFGGVRELCCRRVYDAVDGFAARRGERVVDLGANVGLFSCLSAARGATVLAVEAQHGFVPLITELAQKNGLADRVTVAWGLVGHERGLLSQPERRAEASHMEGAEPPRLDLGALLDANGYDRVDLMKLDIEGSEFALLTGEAPWLERVSRLVMEVHAHFGEPAALRAFLEARGFTVTQLDDDLRPVTLVQTPSSFMFARR